MKGCVNSSVYPGSILKPVFSQVFCNMHTVYLILSGESSRSFFLNLFSVSSMVLPILSLISPSFSLKGKAPLLLSQSSSHLLRSNSLAENGKNGHKGSLELLKTVIKIRLKERHQETLR